MAECDGKPFLREIELLNMLMHAPRFQGGEQNGVGQTCNASTDDQKAVMWKDGEETGDDVEDTENDSCLSSAEFGCDNVLSSEENGTGNDTTDIDDGHLAIHKSMVVIDSVEIGAWTNKTGAVEGEGGR